MSKISIFIDESSTLGLKKKEPYFIIAALILDVNQKKPLKNMIKKLKNIFSINELHAAEMSFEKKKFFLIFSKKKIILINILLHRKIKLIKSYFLISQFASIILYI